MTSRNDTSGTRILRVPPPVTPEPRPIKRTASPRRELVRLLPGQVIRGTNWRITRWLGEGNMGVVYEAQHVEIDRRAAIKVIVASLADDQSALEDFRREANASAKIGSPNIVDVFDFAVLEDGRLMMAMEFVDGRSLHDILLTEGRMAPARLIGLFRQVCKGLQAAHEKGLVHRDIKPENIMVGEVAGRRDTVKLVDFGIASMLGQRVARHAGTPYYMPPEGMLSGVIDGRYDIYSVGCVMFELLTGKPPYTDGSLEKVLEMHHLAPIPELVSDERKLPPKLVEVVRKCLAKSPDERHASMAELEAALCEAQIEGNLRTTWDDLPLPDIEPERRAKLHARMPDRVVRRGLSAWWVPVLLTFGVVLGTVVAWPALSRDDEAAHATAEVSQIEQLGARIHAAAAQANYIYPPVDDPQADTAYKLLRELEGLEVEGALERAAALRSELAAALVRLGDEIWHKEGGEPFALDFYVQAIMFDPTIEPARTRAAMSPGELLALRRKAASGTFSESELIAVEPLAVLAAADAERKREKLAKHVARRKRSASAGARLDALLAADATEPLAAAPLEPAANEPLANEPLAAEQPSEASPAASAAEANETDASASKTKADALVVEADAALAAAQLSEAEALYHKALRVEKHRVEALAGLGRVYFEQANYAKAVQYYELAVQRAKTDAKLHLALGDAYQKTLAYDDALAAYQKAKALGSSKADERIARIEQRTGG